VLLDALLWDLLGHRRSIPVWTLISGAALAVPPILTSDASLLGNLRLWLVVAFALALLLGPEEATARLTARERTV
jgi:L-alanine-DL-glutamate epimerase-like enolase superfamily enzyme